MAVLTRVELPPTFGVNVLDLGRFKGGRIGETLSRILNPFNVLSRLQFRATVDSGTPPEVSESNRRVVSCGSLVAYADIAMDSAVHVFSQAGAFKLELKDTVTCIGFAADRVLVTGTVTGGIEVWFLTIKDPIFEAKCVYKINCGGPNIVPTLITSDIQGQIFQVVLNKGKCMLLFDSIACISGNTDEASVAPVIVDLLQQRPIVDGDCMQFFLATLSLTSVTVTDVASHKAISFDVEMPLRCAWASDIGHLFIVNEAGEVIDCAWSDGLVDVSSFPRTVNGRPSSVEKTGLIVDPDRFDIKDNKIVTVENGEILVYSRRQAGNEKQFPVSPIVCEFALDKQLPVRMSPGDAIIAVRMPDTRSVCVVVRDTNNRVRPVYIAI